MHASHAKEHRSRWLNLGRRVSVLALSLLAGWCGAVWFSQARRPASANFQVIKIAPDNLLTGLVGTPYRDQLRASGGGSAVYLFSLENPLRECLPLGLRLENGAPDEVAFLNGMPQEAGIFSFTVKVVSPPAFPARQRFTLFVRAREDCGALALTEAAPCNPQLVLGVPYSETFNVIGAGTAPYKFDVEHRISQRLPKGMELIRGPRPDQVTLSGVPEESGSFRFYLRVEDANGCYGVLCHDYEIRTKPSCLLNLYPENLSYVQSVQGERLTLGFNPQNGTAPFTFSLDNRPGERLPEGLVLQVGANGEQAILAGNPQEAGTFHFTLRAQDKNDCVASKTYTLTVRSQLPSSIPCNAIAVEPEVLANGTLTRGAMFSQTFTVKAGTSPYTFTAEQLPPGVHLELPDNRSDQITLRGVPATSGSWTFTLKATDRNGCVGTRSYILNVRETNDCPVISFLPRKLPHGIPNNIYPAQTITQQPANLAYSLAVTSGALPPGFTLHGNVLQGMPTQTGIFKFALTAQSGACSGTQEYEVLIVGPLVCPPNLTQSLLPGATEAVINFPPPAAPPGQTVSCTPASGSTFKRGTTTVTCTSTGPAPSTSCNFIVTLTNCTVGCPAPMTATLPAGQCATNVTYTAPVVAGACGPATCIPPSGSSFAAGVTTVTCTAPESEGGNSTCSFTVTVNDTQPPTLACPTNLTRATDRDQCTAIVNYTTPTASDNCLVATVSCIPASGTAFPLGATTVTCMATDTAKNQATCAFTITVNDTQAPTLVCPDNVVKVADQNQCAAVVTYANATASDNCSGVGTPVCTPPSGATFAPGVTTVTCNLRDAAQNLATCSFTVTVDDTQAPVITCPANQHVIASGPTAVRYPLPTVLDNCASPNINCNPASGTTFPLGVSTVKCTATDVANNRATCSFIVTVTSCGIPPPAPVTANVAVGQCAVVVNYPTPATSGSCGAVTCVPTSGSSFPLGVTTVHCSVMDVGGVASSTSFTVTVNDTQAPVITCPPAQQVVASGPSIVSYPPTVVTDNCADPIVNCVPPANTTFPLGVTNVTCTATDRSGNTALCRFPVTVTTCALPCPESVTVNATAGQCAAVVNYPAPAAGAACGTLTCRPASGATFAVGVTRVTCSASDANGVSSSCSFTVTVNDTEAPVPTCPAQVVQATEPGQCQAIVNYPAPTVTDNCPGGTISCTPASGTVFLVGMTTVNCLARDTAGNTAACSFTVAVNDTEAPKLTCPSNQAVNSSVPLVVNYPLPAVTDNCPGVRPVTCNPPPGSTFAVGTTPVNCTVSDVANNTASCSFAVTVTACTLTCPAPITVNTAPGQCATVVIYPAPTPSGPFEAVTCTPPSGSTFVVGVTTVTCGTAGGACGCSFTVTVNDTQAPTIHCPPGQTVNATTPTTVSYPLPTVSDNCPGVKTPVCTPLSGTLFPLGATTVTCMVADAANNIASCSFTVQVRQCTLPSCPAPVTVAANPTACNAVVNYTPPSSSGGCAVTCEPPPGSTFLVGTTTVTCSTRDSVGTVNSCSFTVTVNDTQAPILTCAANNITRAADLNACATVVNYAMPSATDNCPGATVSCSPAANTAFAVGITTVTCTATDAAQNQSTCSFTVTVNDTQAPVPKCPDNIVQANQPGQCQAVVNYAPPAVLDNCPGATISCTPLSGTAFPVGVNPVNCTARDASGNTATCSFTVTVNDTETPRLTCPLDQTVNAAGPAVVNYPLPSATDNCPGVQPVECTPESGSIFAVGSTPVNCVVRDAANNSVRCSFMITINTCPMSCPASITVPAAPGQCAAVVTYPIPTTSGSCGPVICTPPSGATFAKGTTPVTCATAGGTSSCSFTVTVHDTEKPTLTCLPFNESGPAPASVNYPLPAVSDNCAGVGAPVCSPAPGTAFPLGTTPVTCRVTDASGNTAECSFNVTVGPCPLSISGAPVDFGGPITAGLTPNAQRAQVNSQLLTLTNNKCGTVSFGLALQRNDNNNRLIDKNDGRSVSAQGDLDPNDRRPFYIRREEADSRLVRLCNPAQTTQTNSTCESLTLAPGASLSLRLFFDPLIPARASGTGNNLTAAQVLPLDISAQLLLIPAAESPLQSNQVLSTLTAQVTPQLRFVHPCDPARDPAQTPVVRLARAGNEFVVTTTIYDVARPSVLQPPDSLPPRNLNRVRFDLLAGPSATVPVFIYEATTELTNVINATPLHPGQSFAFIQRFSGASSYPEVTHVRVTLNGEADLTTLSGETGCPSAFQAGQAELPYDPAPLVLPDVELAPLARPARPVGNNSRRRQ